MLRAGRRARSGLKPQFSASSTATTSSAILKDAGGTTDAAHRAPAGSGRSACGRTWASNAAQAEAAGAQDDNETRRRARHGALRGAAGGLPGVDFDDLIGLPLQAAAAATPRCATQWQRALRYVLVDEYQDTNAIAVRAAEAARRRARRASPRWATTTSRSTAGAARRSTTCKRLPADYPDAEGDQAGAELPLDRRASCAPPTT